MCYYSFPVYNSSRDWLRIQPLNSAYIHTSIMENVTENTINNISNFNRSENNFGVFGQISATYRMLYVGFLLVVSVFGLTANVLNISAIAHIPHGITTHLKLLISLALADCCIAIYGLLQFLLYLSFWMPSLRFSLCFKCIVWNILVPFAIAASLCNLLALGVDHYIAIVKPLHYGRILSKHRVNIVIVVIWILSMIVGLLKVMTALFKGVPMSLLCKYIISGFPGYNYFSIIHYTFAIGICVILIFLYVRIYIEYLKFKARRCTFHQDEMHNKKAIITTLFIIGTFLICFVPLSLYKILLHFELVDYKAGYMLYSISYVLMVANSLSDPIVYAFRLKVVQQGYKNLFRRCHGN